MSMVLFQTSFYTDVMGLSAGAAAAILLWPRLWDAAFDPIMGVIADRTNTRWGKFRPWVLWTSLPWAVVMVLAYTTPQGWSAGSLIAWAGITNTVLMTLYSMNNMPYSALGGVMTADLNERTKVNSYRFVSANIAQFIVGGLTLPLVVETKSSPKQDFVVLLKNSPWIALFIYTGFHFAMLTFRGGAHYNYYHHFADKAAMFDWVQKFGLTTPELASTGSIADWLGYIVHGTRETAANAADVFNSIVNMVGTGTTIIFIILSAGLSQKFGRKNVALVCFSLAALNAFAMYLLPPTATWGMVALAISGSVVYAPTCAIMWAMYADAADYSEWQTGRRFTGMVFATIGFSLKSGLALGSAGLLWILSGFFNYDTKLPDAANAIAGFRACSSIVVGLFFVAIVLAVAACKLNKETTLKMSADLAERRRKAQPAT